MSMMETHKYRLSPLQSVVLLHHVIHSPDAENDADRTVGELINELDTYYGYVSKSVLESALYCCNLEDERKKFWHPLGRTFDQFLDDVLPHGKEFHKYYNVIVDEERRGTKEEAS